MENSEYACIDIRTLASSLRENIETLHPISNNCCICRVHQHVRCLNESAFTPHVVSIGPLHRDKPELRDMEDLKRRYLKQFFQRTEVSMEDFLTLIKDNEVKLRSYYAEDIQLESKEFVTMVLVDTIFIIEYLIINFNGKLVRDDDLIFRRRASIKFWPDLFLVENQIPCFILNDLFILAKTKTYGEHYDGLTLSKLIHNSFKLISLLEKPLILQEDLIETHFPIARHLLDLLRLSLQPPEFPYQNMPTPDIMLDLQNIPTAMQLHQAGVKFTSGSRYNLLDITFNGGTLKIPILNIHGTTEGILRNLLAFERLHCDTQYINDYVLMMNYLVNTAKDVELLVKKEVMQNWMVDSEAVSTVFHNLRKQTDLSLVRFQYYPIVLDLKAYCDYPWHEWKATLKQDYFNTPWASISVIAAVLLLLLTIIQTVCSVIAL